MLDGRLPETENIIICVTSGLKSGGGQLSNLSDGNLQESSCKLLTEKQDGRLRSGRLREVVAMRELTVLIYHISHVSALN